MTNGCEKVSHNNNVLIITQILYAIVCILGIFGNTLVIYVVTRFSKMQTTTNMYILNLAIADMCFLIGIPFLIITMTLKSWIFGPIFCKIYMTTTSINQITGSMFLLIMSFDRYIAICHPISKANLRTKSVSRILSFAAWILSAIIIIPVIIYTRTYNNGKSISCNIVWESNPELSGQIFTIYMSILGFFIPLSLIMINYFLVLQRVRKLGPKKDASPHKNHQHKKVTKLVMAIIIVYTICWLPYYLTQLTLIFTTHCQGRLTLMFHLLAGCLCYSNSAMNPILYTFMNENFKQSFIATIKCKKPREFLRYSNPNIGPLKYLKRSNNNQEIYDNNSRRPSNSPIIKSTAV